MKGLLIIVRSVKERTEQECVNSLKSAFPNNEILVVHEKPFSKAITKSFELSLEKKAEWLLSIDADVIIQHDGVQDLIKRAKKTDKKIFQIQGLVLDKFFPIWRPAGNHLYRVKHIPKALPLVPSKEFELRPETAMLNQMRDLGYPWLQCDEKIGIHDFEQSYEDIMRKCVLQTKKHKQFIEQISSYWEKASRTDMDFKIASQALKLGESLNLDIKVDKDFLLVEIEQQLKKSKIDEKKEIIKLLDPNHIIDLYDSSLYRKLQEMMFPVEKWQKEHKSPQSKFSRLKSKLFKQIGLK